MTDYVDVGRRFVPGSRQRLRVPDVNGRPRSFRAAPYRPTLPCDEVGDGPPVVLLHAGVADRSMWSNVLPVPGFRAIAPDLPGFGEAAVPPRPQAPWEDIAGGRAAAGLDPAAGPGTVRGARGRLGGRGAVLARGDLDAAAFPALLLRFLT
jgi:pimeloyl-ACP methyl ester carboxylesterase